MAIFPWCQGWATASLQEHLCPATRGRSYFIDGALALAPKDASWTTGRGRLCDGDTKLGDGEAGPFYLEPDDPGSPCPMGTMITDLTECQDWGWSHQSHPHTWSMFIFQVALGLSCSVFYYSLCFLILNELKSDTGIMTSLPQRS